MNQYTFSFAGFGVVATLLASFVPPLAAFNTPVFQQSTQLRRTAPSKMEGVEIELPDFDELFNRIGKVSPLATMVLEGGGEERRGFSGVDENSSGLKWRMLESNKRKLVHQIDKIDNFQKLQCPIVRFRSTLQGPCVGEKFADFVMNIDERRKWDPQIAEAEELYPVYDLATANLAMGMGRYGDCTHMGVGYCRTKANFAVTPREQLTLCGVQNFDCGSYIIWGTEMEEWHNHLLPEGERHTRSKTHLFSTTLTPTSSDSFDVEYVLQLDIGGKIPSFLTTPILTDTVKSLFSHAKKVYADNQELQQFLRDKEVRCATLAEHSLLMTP
mmetsp:Transcript_21130/g.42604  ORF Transcript_21130/g.42604 Transcript_21130/m.42604 type:complete len:328 (-) Transcript_21130:120-1103(-)|eukprot:CAMPEP_0183306744 /NCGR_PEP_ID=MMETSP0160_2-20130417/13625_1 /TAXON_ID=2839 ORGANISM="Odontella Sinensis, Strain Grunow 1884" /NCGR_SAMPLE_ID=MMETSP0160_2 /ASSEMBLY_ACC=CAM_ASM_000250 /LENGTH=327 /DNA_ID=CAMNT_0025470191 /DNA_START=108 /DNA_END=1091 /DNA_ORIENTATION=+